ncbi:MAG: circadian clock KaiB family protein [Aggregatilineales bacterium]
MTDDNQNVDNEMPPIEHALPQRYKPNYVLKLYVAGHTSKSILAIASIRSICEARLRGNYELQVIDVYQQPKLAEAERIIVTPTLVKQFPLPPRKIVGNFTNEEKVLSGLGISETTN